MPDNVYIPKTVYSIAGPLGQTELFSLEQIKVLVDIGVLKYWYTYTTNNKDKYHVYSTAV